MTAKSLTEILANETFQVIKQYEQPGDYDLLFMKFNNFQDLEKQKNSIHSIREASIF